jgi:hypothetical protein
MFIVPVSVPPTKPPPARTRKRVGMQKAVEPRSQPPEAQAPEPAPPPLPQIQAPVPLQMQVQLLMLARNSLLMAQTAQEQHHIVNRLFPTRTQQELEQLTQGLLHLVVPVQQQPPADLPAPARPPKEIPAPEIRSVPPPPAKTRRARVNPVPPTAASQPQPPDAPEPLALSQPEPLIAAAPAVDEPPPDVPALPSKLKKPTPKATDPNTARGRKDKGASSQMKIETFLAGKK